MDLHQLQEFITLAQVKNFLEASDILFMSQSTLSRHIKSLEDDLGVPLFRRTTRHVYLTKYGEMFLPYAHRISAQFEQFSDELATEKKEKDICLRIGTIPAMTVYDISSILSSFKKNFSQYKMNIISSHTNNTDLLELLRWGDCDLAFIREDFPEKNDDIQRLPLLSEQMVAVVPKSHPFSSLHAIPLTDLRHENIVTFSQKTTIYDFIHGACTKAGFEPNVVMSDHSADHLINCIQLGTGVGLLLEKQIDPNRDYYENICVLKIEPMIVSYINLCYLKGSVLSSAASDFLQMYQAWLASHGNTQDECPSPVSSAQ